jgi:hypothetical protein
MARSKRTTAKAKSGGEIFRYNGFDVVVPRSVLKEWEAQAAKWEQMIKVPLAHYALMRADWAMAKIKPIQEGMRCQSELIPEKGDSLLKKLKKLENPEVKERVLELLKYERYRAWNVFPVSEILFMRAVMMAARDGDEDFFKALGERLKEKPIPYKPPHKPSNLTELLLLNWLANEGICFCWFSDKALRDFLESTGETYTLDAIKKAYARLNPKLPRLGRALVRSVEKNDKGLIILNPRAAKSFHEPESWTHDPKMHLSERELTASYKSHRQVPPH